MESPTITTGSESRTHMSLWHQFVVVHSVRDFSIACFGEEKTWRERGKEDRAFFESMEIEFPPEAHATGQTELHATARAHATSCFLLVFGFLHSALMIYPSFAAVHSTLITHSTGSARDSEERKANRRPSLHHCRSSISAAFS